MKDKGKQSPDKENISLKLTRRDILKGLATVPFAGALAISAWEKLSSERARKRLILEELGLTEEAPPEEVVTEEAAPVEETSGEEEASTEAG